MTTTNNTLRPATHHTVNQIASSHIDLSSRYGCRAFMVVVTFMYCGIAHRARRFFRADLPSTGKIELYTLEPFAGQWTTCTELGWYESAASEDFLAYVAANPTSKRDRLATAMIYAASGGDVMGAEQAQRFAAIEMA